MKTMKIYKTPVCEVYHLRMDMEDLCFNVNGSESGLDVMGAKRNQFIIDDSDDESQESEIQ